MYKIEPSVITVHDAFYRLRYESFLWRSILKIIFRAVLKANVIITNSHFTKDDLIRNLPIKASKIRVIYPGVNHDIFKPMNKNKCRETLQLPVDEHIILTVGGEKRKDNITTLLKAFSLLQKSLPDSLLVIVGKPNSAVLKAIQKLHIWDKCLIFSSVSVSKLVMIYNSADIFIFPSIYEGFGLTPLEAMACGIPVIASKVTAIPEVLGNAAVYLKNPYDHVTLRKLIENVLENEEIKTEICSKGLKRVREFTWERTVSETIKVYNEASTK